MPFQSQAQRAFMYSQHPDIAKRWEAMTPKGKLPEHKMAHANESSESEESNKPGVPRLPRTGDSRDFKVLHPSAKARLKTSHSASTKESDEEWGTEASTLGAHNGPQKMSLKGSNVLDPLAKRDEKVSSRKRV